jgi:uncharacterized membrane protein HdeD (DUF308 family)
MSQAVLLPGAHHDERVLLSRQWWIFLILGLISVVVGLMAISSAFVSSVCCCSSAEQPRSFTL